MPTIGPYEVLDELGRGGMGVVFRVRHAPTGAIRALKLLDGAPDPEGLERFRREGQALARVAGAGVVPVHEAGVAGRRLYLALDFMAGGSLRARLRFAGRLDWREAAALGKTLATTLARCHVAGLVHRDVKPDNVLFDERGEPRLADFGCVRDLGASALTLSGTTIGTVAYMAPEQLMGQRAGAPADVWALGVVLHEIVSGERPFGDGPAVLIIEAARDRRRPSLEKANAPAALEALVARALEPDAARRPTADELARALAAILSGKAEAARAPGKLRGLPLGGLLVLAALLVAGGLVAVLVRGVGRGGSSTTTPAGPTPAPVTPGPKVSPRGQEASSPSPTVVDEKTQALRTAAVAVVVSYLDELKTAPFDAMRDPAQQLEIEDRPATRALAKLESAAELAGLLARAGDGIWELAKLRRTGNVLGLDADSEARGLHLKRAFEPYAGRSEWLRAGLLAFTLHDLTHAETNAPPGLDGAPARLVAKHPLEAGWLLAVVSLFRIRKADPDELPRIVEECRDAFDRVSVPAFASDPLTIEARVLLLEDQANCESLLAARPSASGTLGHVQEVRRLAGRGIEIGDKASFRPRVEGLRLQQVYVAALALRRDRDGRLVPPLTRDLREALVGEIRDQERIFTRYNRPHAPVLTLVHDLRALDLAHPSPETRDALTRIRDGAHGLSASANPELAATAIAIEIECAVELGDPDRARALAEAHRKELEAFGSFLTGRSLEEIESQLSSVGAPPK